MRQIKVIDLTFSERHCITSSLERDHDVSCAAVDLLEIQRNDVTVDLQSLGQGGVYITLSQVWSVESYPAAVSEGKWFTDLSTGASLCFLFG